MGNRTIRIEVESDCFSGLDGDNEYDSTMSYQFAEGDAGNFLYHASRLMLAMGYHPNSIRTGMAQYLMETALEVSSGNDQSDA